MYFSQQKYALHMLRDLQYENHSPAEQSVKDSGFLPEEPVPDRIAHLFNTILRQKAFFRKSIFSAASIALILHPQMLDNYSPIPSHCYRKKYHISSQDIDIHLPRLGRTLLLAS